MQVLKPEDLAQRANDHEQENTNGTLSKPQLRWSSHGSGQPQRDEDDFRASRRFIQEFLGDVHSAGRQLGSKGPVETDSSNHAASGPAEEQPRRGRAGDESADGHSDQARRLRGLHSHQHIVLAAGLCIGEGLAEAAGGVAGLPLMTSPGCNPGTAAVPSGSTAVTTTPLSAGSATSPVERGKAADARLNSGLP